jgi:hypothetical protein
VVCAPSHVQRVINLATAAGEPGAVRIGLVVAGARGVRYL